MAIKKQQSSQPSVFLAIVVSLLFSCVAGSRVVRQKRNVFPKTPLKTIPTQDGDVIDCVHIYAQPAFDHPLLKDHVIRTTTGSDRGEKRSGLCPENSVPIVRLPKNASNVAHPPLRRIASNVVHTPLRRLDDLPHGFPMADGTPEYSAQRGEFPSGYDVYGGSASLNIWNPKTAVPGEYSSVRVMILGMLDNDVYKETIEAGWMVFKGRYGDPISRFYSYWRNEKGEGCFDMDCPGFVQTNSNIRLAMKLPCSVYDGQQYVMDTQIFKDTDENWWLVFQDEKVGYWPSSLFSYLNNYADTVEFGGEVLNSNPDGHHTSTQMGNGLSASGENNRACKLFNMRYFNKDRAAKEIPISRAVVTNDNCYDRFYGDGTGGTPEHLFIGGSGYGPNCP